MVSVAACASLPQRVPPGPVETATAPAETGAIADLVDRFRTHHGDTESGFALIDRAADAFTLRLALVDAATQSLDVMYYIWADDDSGNLFLLRLMMAADRGVRVRILVDDLLMYGEDATLAALQAHPQIDLRLFNPWRSRSLLGRALEGMAHFTQANRRMHTKLLVSDNGAMILGGRNIANEYFGLSAKSNFHDLDVLAVGDSARDGSTMFDHYWNSELAVSAQLLSIEADAKDTQQLHHRLEAYVSASDVLQQTGFHTQPTDRLLHGWSRTLVPGDSEVAYDTLDGSVIRYNMSDTLGRLMDRASAEIQVTNAYFIPEQSDINGIQQLCDRGVHMRLLTNSLESHDVPAVNSHYRPWRKALLGTCLELYELRADAELLNIVNTEPIHSKYIGLHSKAMVVDRRYSFIGSFNFDPRSAALNTEMGLLVDSAQLGEALAQHMGRDMQPERSWQVTLDDNGNIVWSSTRGQKTSQPARGLWQRIQDTFFGLLPKKYF